MNRYTCFFLTTKLDGAFRVKSQDNICHMTPTVCALLLLLSVSTSNSSSKNLKLINKISTHRTCTKHGMKKSFPCFCIYCPACLAVFCYIHSYIINNSLCQSFWNEHIVLIITSSSLR